MDKSRGFPRKTTMMAAPWAMAASLLGWCLCAHAVADGLQGSLSGLKRRLGPDGERKAFLAWTPWLALHAAAHGAGVAMVLGSPLAGLLEWGAHGLIDLGKCEKKYGSAVDQALHAACKVAWVLTCA